MEEGAGGAGPQKLGNSVKIGQTYETKNGSITVTDISLHLNPYEGKVGTIVTADVTYSNGMKSNETFSGDHLLSMIQY